MPITAPARPLPPGQRAFWASLPEGADGTPATQRMAEIAQREAMMLDAIDRGMGEYVWCALPVAEGGHTATFAVLADALKIGGVRLAVSAVLAQQIADRLGASLLTPKLADRIYQARSQTVLPQTGPVSSSTSDMIHRSAMVDAAATAAGVRGLLQTAGKHWLIANELGHYPPGSKGENYGWHIPGASWDGSSWEPAVTPGLRVVQGQGWFHPPQHTDSSQTLVLVRRDVVVDGRDGTLEEVLTTPALAPLASHQGVVTVRRQPGVDALAPLTVAQHAINGARRNALALTGAAAGGMVAGPLGVLGGGLVGAGLDWWRKR